MSDKVRTGSGTGVLANGPFATTGVVTDPLTTKGDIWVFGTADARLPIGADGTLLIADSTQALGLRWKPAPATITSTVTYSNLAANSYSAILLQGGLSGTPVAGMMWSFEFYGDLEVSATTTNVNVRSILTTGAGNVITTGQFLGTVLGATTVRGIVVRGHITIEDATHARGTFELHSDTGAVNVLNPDDVTVPNQTTAIALAGGSLFSLQVQIAWTAQAATNVCNFYTGNIQQVI